MITADFTGNLGNHMFQYALTRTVAEMNGYDWGFNPITSNDYYGGTPQMDFMDIDYGIVHNAKWREFPEGIDKEYFEKYSLRPGKNIFFYYDPGLFDVEDGTKLVIACGQNAAYYDKEKVREWFRIKNDVKEKYKKLDNIGITLDEDTVVLNVRGGEYKGVPSLILEKDYWYMAMSIMRERNPRSKFICITDDQIYAKTLFAGDVPVYHISISGDYFVINNAYNLILSNSSFAIFPTWLNERNPFVIAPRYWARYNVHNGDWISSPIWTFGWNFLGKDGNLYKK